jgi:lipoprotein-releasing system permease protein
MSVFQPVSIYVGLRYSVPRGHGFFFSFITWISLLGVAVGVAAVIIVLSVMNGFESELRSKLLSVSAHARIINGGASISDWRVRLQQLKGSPGLVGVAPFLDTDAMLSRQTLMSGAILRGIDPALEPNVSTIGDSMREGKLSDLEPGLNRVVLGRALAYQLQVGVGDSVTAMIPGNSDADGGGQPRLQQFNVVGIFEVGLQEDDGVLALINLQDAEAFRGLAGPTGIQLKFTDVLKAPELARIAAQRLSPGLEVRDWTQDNAVYFHAIRTEKTMMGLLLMLIVAIAVFNIVATLVMVVSEKRTDIAILRTLGLSPRGVVGIFIMQGVIIGWLGIIIGATLGVSVALNVDVVTTFLQETLGFYIFDPDVFALTGIPSETHADEVVWIIVTALLMTVVATLYPALHAAKTQPAEVLRYE